MCLPFFIDPVNPALRIDQPVFKHERSAFPCRRKYVVLYSLHILGMNQTGITANAVINKICWGIPGKRLNFTTDNFHGPVSIQSTAVHHSRDVSHQRAITLLAAAYLPLTLLPFDFPGDTHGVYLQQLLLEFQVLDRFRMENGNNACWLPGRIEQRCTDISLHAHINQHGIIRKFLLTLAAIATNLSANHVFTRRTR